MVDGDQSSGAGADRTPPLGARGRSSSFPNLAQNAFVAALGVGDGAAPAPAGGSDVGDVAPARARAAWYLPPLGLRHLSEVRARNLVPPRGAEHSRGAGFRFTLATGGGAGEPEAVVYTSEVATDTLNPDWEPLDDVDLERRARGVASVASSSSDESADAGLGEDVNVFTDDPPSPPALTLTVWHVENPARGGAHRRVFTTRVALDDLVRAPTEATQLATKIPSVFGPFDGSERPLDGPLGLSTPLISQSVVSHSSSYPPNTPLVRLLPRTRWGSGGWAGQWETATWGTRHSWRVPGGRSWRALREVHELAVKADAEDAADAADVLIASRASTSVEGGVEGGSRAAAGGHVRKESTGGSPLSTRSAQNGGGVNGVGGGIERADARELRASTDSVVHAAAGMARAMRRRDALRDAVGERLGSKGAERGARGGEEMSNPGAGTLGSSLIALRGMLGEAKLDVAALRRDVEARREDARERAAANARRRDSLAAGRKRLERARSQLKENALNLAGARGRGRLHKEQRELVARRWQLVADLARVFPIAPVRSGDEDGGGGGGGGAGGKQKRSWMVAGVPLDLGQSGKPNGAGSLSAAIGHGLLPGSTVSQSEQERRASALGYVTQAVLQLAAVLDVPLRYPVAPGASRSYICDLQQTWAASSHSRGDRSGGNGGDGRGPGSPGAVGDGGSSYAERAVMWRRYEFPLFADGASGSAESTKFTYAVFLLNKDLEQLLNAHGLLAVGPRQTLPNLRRLFHGRTNRCEVSAAAGGGGGEAGESVASRVASGEENGSGGGYEATVALTR